VRAPGISRFAALLIGLALVPSGARAAESAEAAGAFEAALRLDDAALDGRPAARAAFEAARRGAAWP